MEKLWIIYLSQKFYDTKCISYVTIQTLEVGGELCLCATVFVWRSEDNLKEWILSLYCIVPLGTELRPSSVVAGPITLCAISLDPQSLSFKEIGNFSSTLLAPIQLDTVTYILIYCSLALYSTLPDCALRELSMG